MSQDYYYFAFGSNMNHYRLHQRIGDFKTLGVACLKQHQLVFHKRGGDDSGKCTVVSNPTDQVWGVLYEIDSDQKVKLDYFEGVGHGYSAVYFDVDHNEISLNALLYQAELDAMDEGLQPLAWYKAYVVSGAKYHQLPPDYIKLLEETGAIEDHDPHRHQENLQILNGIY